MFRLYPQKDDDKSVHRYKKVTKEIFVRAIQNVQRAEKKKYIYIAESLCIPPLILVRPEDLIHVSCDCPWPSSGGKKRLAWWIHPWQASAWMSSHASSIAWSSDTCWWGLRSYTFHHRHAEKNSSIGFRNGEYGGRYSTTKRVLSVNQFWARAAWWK